MPADTLVDMARRACMKSCRGITDIGDTPYELLRPILLKIENPEQLRTLEQNSPQIIGKDREIWLNMLKRDIPDYETKPHEPSDPRNWWKVYRKLKREAHDELAAGDERLKAALNSALVKKGVATTKILSRDQVPRQPVRKRQAITHDYLSGRTGSKGAHKQSLMDKIRREARSASTAKMSRPTHELQKRASGVVKAPQSFVRDIKHQNLARVPIAQAREAMGYTSGGTSKPIPHPTGSSYDMTQDREARLRSLKSGKQNDFGGAINRSVPGRETGYNVNHLTLDFLEDDDDEELFGSRPTARASPPASKDTSRPRFPSPQPTPPKRREPPKLFVTGQSLKRKRPEPGVT